MKCLIRHHLQGFSILLTCCSVKEKHDCLWSKVHVAQWLKVKPPRDYSLSYKRWVNGEYPMVQRSLWLLNVPHLNACAIVRLKACEEQPCCTRRMLFWWGDKARAIFHTGGNTSADKPLSVTEGAWSRASDEILISALTPLTCINAKWLIGHLCSELGSAGAILKG